MHESLITMYDLPQQGKLISEGNGQLLSLLLYRRSGNFRVKIFKENFFTKNFFVGQLYPRKLFYTKFFYPQARSKNLLCWRLPCIICDIQEAAIGTRF